MYIKVQDLPKSIIAMLNSVSYNKADIKINVESSVSPQSFPGDGYRAIFAVTKISDNIEEITVTKGSWGGINAFTTNVVDNLDSQFTIPNNVVVLKAREGGSKPVIGELYISQSNALLLLPFTSELTESEKKVLACYKGLTSAGRKEAFSRMPARELTCVQTSLLEKGFIAKKGNGVSITLEGKNALGDNYSHYLY
jgi:hypothetical protein